MRLFLGSVFTVIYGAGFWVFLNHNKISTSELKLNEWGDLLTGFFAPLAFVWFVLAYLQQSQEMKAGTKALRSQRDQQILAAQLSAYTALLNHETKEHALFSSFGDEYVGAAKNARKREKEHKEEIDKLLQLLKGEKENDILK